MKVSITQCEIRGSVAAPSSKSYTIRGLICASLAGGQSRIIRPLKADDPMSARNVLRQVGVNIEDRDSDWIVFGGNFRAPGTELFCGDSAATLRFMAALCALVPGKCRLTAGGSLAKRPVGPLIDALRQLGVSCSASGDLPPVEVDGGTLLGGTTSLPGDISSQFVSALITAAPRARNEVTVQLTTPPESKPYILMTMECLNKFGIEVNTSNDLRLFKIKPQEFSPAVYEVEGDWSSASYILAAGAVGGRVVLSNLNPFSLQADRKILALLKDMGADVRINQNNIEVNKGKLKAIETDLADCIDLLPIMMALAAVAAGTSIFTGVKRARLKESDRISAMRRGLKNMGAAVDEGTDSISITGSRLHGTAIDSMSDHRIAMAFSVLGLLSDDLIIDGAECVSKTYPGYWEDMKRIGVNIVNA